MPVFPSFPGSNSVCLASIAIAETIPKKYECALLFKGDGSSRAMVTVGPHARHWLATMNKKQRWALAGHAKRSETVAFSSRAAVACRYPTFVLQNQMVPKRKSQRWILQTDLRGLKTDPPA
jgi:hypothetical protein